MKRNNKTNTRKILKHATLHNTGNNAAKRHKQCLKNIAKPQNDVSFCMRRTYSWTAHVKHKRADTWWEQHIKGPSKLRTRSTSPHRAFQRRALQALIHMYSRSKTLQDVTRPHRLHVKLHCQPCNTVHHFISWWILYVKRLALDRHK